MQKIKSNFSFLDFYPDRGTYHPAEQVNLMLELEAVCEQAVTLQFELTRGVKLLVTEQIPVVLKAGLNQVRWTWQAPDLARGGYGVQVSLSLASESMGMLGETAFDILEDWTVFPRYGFLCDFSPERMNAHETIQSLARYHINGLQFYDWQYRHDSLVPPQDIFTDPLGRPLSLLTVRSLMHAAHACGMAAMPYLAIYAASASFWREHMQWALFDRSGKEIPFGENFLGIMNPARGSNWQLHLLREAARVLASLPFDGLHVDQYGDPKEGFDSAGKPVNLPEAFADFVSDAVMAHPGKPVLFNAVGNWPIENLAQSPAAFNYIEVWHPDTTYPDLIRIVRNARALSGNKPVVIAVYIPAARQINNLLACALIASAGGSRILIGENERLLSDPYFPKHEPMSEELNTLMRRYADFPVQYADWFAPYVPESAGIVVNTAPGLATFVRETGQGWSVCLVNLSGMSNSRWNEQHAQPDALTDVRLEIRLPAGIQTAWLASPHCATNQAVPLEFSANPGHVQVSLPRVEIWQVLYFEKTIVS